jgi:5'-3' exoribonuclease 1
MGIPGFYGRWLVKTYKQVINKGLPPLVSSLSLDLNGVLHSVKSDIYNINSKTEEEIKEMGKNIKGLEEEYKIKLWEKIIEIVNIVKPIDALIIAVDGVAPGAKLQQQKVRRERATQSTDLLSSFDSNCITPGTDFMIDIDIFLNKMINSNKQLLPNKVLYSSHLFPGEGEHKIMKYYRDGFVSDGLSDIKGGVHVLYGLDADLIMLSLVSPVNRIFLFREKIEEVINIDKFKLCLKNDINKNTAINDFVVLMFLCGNDFLPQSPLLHNMDNNVNKLLKIYSQCNLSLTN